MSVEGSAPAKIALTTWSSSANSQVLPFFSMVMVLVLRQRVYLQYAVLQQLTQMLFHWVHVYLSLVTVKLLQLIQVVLL